MIKFNLSNTVVSSLECQLPLQTTLTELCNNPLNTQQSRLTASLLYMKRAAVILLAKLTSSSSNRPKLAAHGQCCAMPPRPLQSSVQSMQQLPLQLTHHATVQAHSVWVALAWHPCQTFCQ